jgi:hypothetical protein
MAQSSARSNDAGMGLVWDHLGSVTIDVDGANCYRRIHGLPDGPADRPDPIYEKALPRFLELCAALDIQATLFVVGEELNGVAADLVQKASRQGHEIASHSHRHDYRMIQWNKETQRADLQAAADRIGTITGKRPVGFRAPGYNQSEKLFDVLEEEGYAYDSSFFPTPFYFAARATALLAYRLRQRPSHSLVGSWREFAAPRLPFFPSTKKRTRPGSQKNGARRLVELPMSVGPGRTPWLGTTVAHFPDPVGRLLTAGVLRHRGPAIFELHAIDFADAEDGYESALVGAQPDLRTPLSDKMRRLRSTLERMRNRRQLQSLSDLAQRAWEVGPQGHQ